MSDEVSRKLDNDDNGERRRKWFADNPELDQKLDEIVATFPPMNPEAIRLCRAAKTYVRKLDAETAQELNRKTV